MRRALDLAKLGIGSVSPNPVVGCVLVAEDRIIGEGFHQKYGENHAEVNAIESVKDKALIKAATAYVTLEPCSHHGKTPPCASRLISEGIRNVVIASLDPNPLVSGKGVSLLKKSGIHVSVGLLAENYEHINRRFFTFHRKKRPYIILKWAETADGYLARTDYSSKWISNARSRQWVHKWRSEEDAVMVGYNTAFHDNPMLNVRSWNGRNPVRIFMDRDLSLPDSHHLKNGDQRTICITSTKEGKDTKIEYLQIANFEDTQGIFKEIYNRNIQSIIVEGGRKTLQSIIKEGIWDEARIFRSSNSFGDGIKAPMLAGELFETRDVGTDRLSIYTNN
jgi:diaminohydroxyphosphoribosylaminopyrimidine deaminase/5-amino-6-(5-phosphoribosylamino)uracil reductase